MRTRSRHTRSWLSATLAALVAGGLLAAVPTSAEATVHPGLPGILYYGDLFQQGTETVVRGYHSDTPGCQGPSTVLSGNQIDQFSIQYLAADDLSGVGVGSSFCAPVYESFETPLVARIEGARVAGTTLRAKTNSYQPSNATVTYRWTYGSSSVPNHEVSTASTMTWKDEYRRGVLTLTVTAKLGKQYSTSQTGQIQAPVAFSDFTPVISGSGKPGEQLTVAEPAGVTPTPSGFSYAWTVSGSDIVRSTTRTFTPALGDVGQTVTLTVTAKGENGDPVDKAVQVTKVIESGPGFTGDLQAGEPLTFPASRGGTITLSPSADCSDGTATPLANGTTSFTLPVSAAGRYVQLKDGASTGTCVGPVANAVLDDFAADFTGDVAVGETVTAVDPAGLPAGTTFGHTWTVGEKTVGEEESYTLTPADAGKSLTLTVTANADGYDEKSATSDAVTVAKGSLPDVPVTLSDSTPATAPTTGDVLTLSPDLSGLPEDASSTWAWGHVTPGVRTKPCVVTGESATDTYTVTNDEAGQTICAVVTTTAGGYEDTTTKVLADSAALGTFSTPTLTLSNDPAVGVETSVDVTDLSPDGTKAYSWKVGDTVVSEDPTYRPSPADVGQDLTVTVTVTKDSYVTSTTTSTAATIALGTLTFDAPTISGIAQVGETLTRTELDPADLPEGATASYVWGALLDGQPECTSLGVTGTTLTLPGTTVGARICVITTVKAEGYEDAVVTSDLTDTVITGTFEAPQVTIDDTTPTVGQTLTASTDLSGLDLVSEPSVLYRWGTVADVPEARGTTCDLFDADASEPLVVAAASQGDELCVVATVSADGYESTSSTATTDAVVGRDFGVGSVATISGLVDDRNDALARVGATSTAVLPTDLPEDTTASYAWSIGDDVVGSEETFTPVGTQADQSLVLTITLTAPGYEPATLTSSPTTILKGFLPYLGVPIVDSTPSTPPTTGDVLTLADLEITEPAGVSLSTPTWGHLEEGENQPECIREAAPSASHTVNNQESGSPACFGATLSAPGYRDRLVGGTTEELMQGVLPTPVVTFANRPKVNGYITPVVSGLDDVRRPDRVQRAYLWTVDGKQVLDRRTLQAHAHAGPPHDRPEGHRPRPVLRQQPVGHVEARLDRSGDRFGDPERHDHQARTEVHDQCQGPVRRPEVHDRGLRHHAHRHRRRQRTGLADVHLPDDRGQREAQGRRGPGRRQQEDDLPQGGLPHLLEVEGNPSLPAGPGGAKGSARRTSAHSFSRIS